MPELIVHVCDLLWGDGMVWWVKEIGTATCTGDWDWEKVSGGLARVGRLGGWDGG